MNKEVYTAVADRIEDQVSGLKWIDFDMGQLDVAERPPVAFPCCLIDIAYPQCDDMSEKAQVVSANITLRVAFNITGQTNQASVARDLSLGILDVIDDIHTALQGWSTTALSRFSRTGAQPEKRRDGLKVYRITYQTTFAEDTTVITT